MCDVSVRKFLHIAVAKLNCDAVTHICNDYI